MTSRPTEVAEGAGVERGGGGEGTVMGSGRR